VASRSRPYHRRTCGAGGLPSRAGFTRRRWLPFLPWRPYIAGSHLWRRCLPSNHRNPCAPLHPYRHSHLWRRLHASPRCPVLQWRRIAVRPWCARWLPSNQSHRFSMGGAVSAGVSSRRAVAPVEQSHPCASMAPVMRRSHNLWRRVAPVEPVGTVAPGGTLSPSHLWRRWPPVEPFAPVLQWHRYRHLTCGGGRWLPVEPVAPLRTGGLGRAKVALYTRSGKPVAERNRVCSRRTSRTRLLQCAPVSPVAPVAPVAPVEPVAPRRPLATWSSACATRIASRTCGTGFSRRAGCPSRNRLAGGTGGVEPVGNGPGYRPVTCWRRCLPSSLGVQTRRTWWVAAGRASFTAYQDPLSHDTVAPFAPLRSRLLPVLNRWQPGCYPVAKPGIGPSRNLVAGAGGTGV